MFLLIYLQTTGTISPPFIRFSLCYRYYSFCFHPCTFIFFLKRTRFPFAATARIAISFQRSRLKFFCSTKTLLFSFSYYSVFLCPKEAFHTNHKNLLKNHLLLFHVLLSFKLSTLTIFSVPLNLISLP